MRRVLTTLFVFAMIFVLLNSTPPPGYWMTVAHVYAHIPAWSDGLLHQGKRITHIYKLEGNRYALMLFWRDKYGSQSQRVIVTANTRIYVIDWEKYT